MSKFRFTATALAITAIFGFSAASAQNPSNQTIGKPLQAGQPTKVADKPLQQQAGSKNEQSDHSEAHRTSTNSQQPQGPTVKEALTQKLIKANEAEIELATLAQEKTENEELKQFASMLVKDHQQFNKILQQHVGNQHSNQSNSGKAKVSESLQANTGTIASSNAATVPTQLCEIGEQACANSLKMTKEMLGNYEGQDFSMAFLGQQCVAHTMMLAELKAIESVGPKELQQIASQAAMKVEKHLDKAKQLAKKLEDDRKSRE